MDKIILEDLKRASLDKVKELMKENNGEITGNTLEPIGDLVDIFKDVANIEYWCMKEDSEDMYRGYDRDYRDGYDRRERDPYGARRRDSRGRYRGHDYIDEMDENYSRYMEGRSRYGANEDTDKSFHYMVEALEDFIKVLHEEASNEQQRQQLRETLQRSMM